MERPETRYVAVGDADVAYQVFGNGSFDLLYSYGLGSHLELFWELPPFAEFFARLASFSRLIMFDRRGQGVSDAVPRNAFPTWEEWAEDIIAVLGAAESQRTAVMAAVDAGPIAMLFAATHPEQVSSLILINTSARYLVADDYSIGVSPEAIDSLVEMLVATWGTPTLSQLAAPSATEDPELTRAVGTLIRCSATPRTAGAQYLYILRSLDVRDALPLIQVPTLVLHVKDNSFVPIAHGRYIAEHIADATFVELPGGDIGLTPVNYRLTDEVAEFLTGARVAVDVERILTTVLFTDIVRSTERAASLGNQRWRSLLDTHDRAVRDQFARFRGREINTTGDGFVACFDGPARAIRCAQAVAEVTNRIGVDVRLGLHTGECDVRGDDLGGLAVHIAARLGTFAEPGEVLVSGTVKDLVVGSGIDFHDRGEHVLKGVPGTWRLFAAEA
jgi:class 3 adenylate cyclase/alpha-beta hydrolase superfamily lysophospholipase